MQPKDPVRLRKRKMPSGNTSLYLDIYLSGRRQYEYLKLYLQPERNKADKERNREVLAFAEAIRAKRLVEIRNGEYGFKNKTGGNILLIDFFRVLCESKRKGKSRGTYSIWRCCQNYLEKYCNSKIVRISNVDEKWVRGFRDYLCSKKLSQNTKAKYFDAFCASMHTAHMKGLIPTDPVVGVDKIRTEETERMYLTIDELKRIVATPCGNDNVRRAFLFSCLTGLRYSDVECITWENVKRQGNFTRIFFRQKKTRGLEYVDITEEAARLLGQRMNDNSHIFTLPSVTQVEKIIQDWVYASGITKHITYHCSRHTFAVMMLDLGTDIYTVSKLLGHRDLSTTQIYAKVLDKNKQAAVSRIPAILDLTDIDEK